MTAGQLGFGFDDEALAAAPATPPANSSLELNTATEASLTAVLGTDQRAVAAVFGPRGIAVAAPVAPRAEGVAPHREATDGDRGISKAVVDGIGRGVVHGK